MRELSQLVHEALDGLREERQGCFVHNAAAGELLSYGEKAISAIEDEVLSLAAKGRRPRDLASVMVVYSQLLRRFEAGDRVELFLQRLPQSFREVAIGHACGAWHLYFPHPCQLPKVVRHFVEDTFQNGGDDEREIAQRILQRDDRIK